MAVSVLGGDPLTRLVLDRAARRIRREDDRTDDDPAPAPAEAAEPEETALRGGTTIGYLERGAVALAIVVGYPEAIAVVVAVKGIGRFSELVSPATRERFIIGTLTSLLWGCLLGALAHLALR